MLTQGDKLNIIKATRQLTAGSGETEAGGEKGERQRERRERREKITDHFRQNKVSSRVNKPNILTKRDSVTSRYDNTTGCFHSNCLKI